jgi:hypothetical protein
MFVVAYTAAFPADALESVAAVAAAAATAAAAAALTCGLKNSTKAKPLLMLLASLGMKMPPAAEGNTHSDASSSIGLRNERQNMCCLDP